MSMRRLDRAVLVAWLVAAAGCPVDTTPASTPTGRPSPSAGAGNAPGSSASPGLAKPTANTSPSDKPAEGPLGRLRPDAPLPLLEILGAEPPVVERHLGDPLGKGETKKTCVRFVPDRVFFRCAFAWQRYADRSGRFGAIEVRYEDGRAASIAFEQLPGEGEIDPRAALATVGLELPGEPKQSAPATNVTLWSWWNSDARLLVHGQQYRVEVSSVDMKWDKAKVDVILNHPLTPDQKAKIVEATPQVGAG